MKKKSSSSMKKYQTGGTSGSSTSSGFQGGMKKTTSPGGSYVTKKTYDDQGKVVKETQRRTVKGFLTGAPKAKGTTTRVFKKGGTKK